MVIAVRALRSAARRAAFFGEDMVLVTDGRPGAAHHARLRAAGRRPDADRAADRLQPRRPRRERPGAPAGSTKSSSASRSGGSSRSPTSSRARAPFRADADDGGLPRARRLRARAHAVRGAGRAGRARERHERARAHPHLDRVADFEGVLDASPSTAAKCCSTRRTTWSRSSATPTASSSSWARWAGATCCRHSLN